MYSCVRLQELVWLKERVRGVRRWGKGRRARGVGVDGEDGSESCPVTILGQKDDDDGWVSAVRLFITVYSEKSIFIGRPVLWTSSRETETKCTGRDGCPGRD